MEGVCSDDGSSIRNLPDDCLLNIFQWLDCSSDRESFGLTCHRWLNIQNFSRRSLQFQCSLSLLDAHSLSHGCLVVNSSHLRMLLTRFQHLESLSLSGCTEMHDSGLVLLQNYCLKLQSLYLDCCFGISDGGFALVAKGCRALTVLSLYRCYITDTGLEAIANRCSALKRVNLSHTVFITDSGLRILTQACRQLQSLKISYCREVTGTGLSGCSDMLTYIDAESCNLRREGIAGLVSGGGLECLNISCVSYRIYEDGFAAIGGGFATRLKILNLRMCRAIGNESIIAIAKGCPLLEEWNLALCYEVKLPGWESIGANCNNLKTLHVNRCRNLCDRGLQAIMEGCVRLSTLYVSRNLRLSSYAIEVFKINRNNVKVLEEEIVWIGPDWIEK